VSSDLVPPVLHEAADSGLRLDRLPGNSAKIRLLLDLARHISERGSVTILDVGAGGKFMPFNMWEPFLPFVDRIELVGTDIAHLEPTAARAAEIGFPVDLRHGGVARVLADFGPASFDVVVSTQVLEHLPHWARDVAGMSDLLRPGGMLYITCDSGDAARTRRERTKLLGKCAYAWAASRSSAISRLGSPYASGDWERAPSLPALRRVALSQGLEVERIRYYGLGDVKRVQAELDSMGRLLSLALDEALEPRIPALFRLLYLRARRPRPTGRST
jgi:SAM-dependent methyltransferase